MKLFANKKLFKKIVILLVFITLVNAVIPLHMVSADADEDYGGRLFRPLFRFFAGVVDLLVRGLQNIFIGSGDIKPDNGGGYQIRYSPGVIFSNKVPGLDANFINPGPSREAKTLMLEKRYGNMNLSGINFYLGNLGVEADINLEDIKAGTPGAVDNLYWNNCDEGYFLEFHFAEGILRSDKVTPDELSNLDYGNGKEIELKIIFREEGELYYEESSEMLDADSVRLANLLQEKEWTFYKNGISTGKTRESTAAQLQVTVSKWYKALRLVSLVALLSVLVYVGIRIIISSTGQEKAKYKKMIGDWVAAICILFVLNYIMAFTMDIVNRIIDVFSSSSLVDANEVDTLMSGIRNNINDNQYSDLTTFTNLILYIVLVIYTIIFTIHYLKRVVYLAFFTMIAPLIAVTYPIDRIKDGQAQAFGTWIKEYTFNAAIPVIHIIIYSALVGSAKDLAIDNPLYAIVCISFLIPAEKFFKKLFGFEKASTVGQLGAAAGGALIMNAINKMGHKSGKQAAAKAGASSSSASRGLSANAMSIASGDGGAGALGGGGSPAGGAPTGGGASGGTGGAGGAGTTGGAGTGTTIRKPRPIMQGLGAVRRKYINKNTLKSAGRMARKVALGGAGAAIAGSAGLIAGISTGDFSNALKYGVAGAGTGFSGANYLGDKLLAGEKNLRETFKEGAIGQEEYNNLKSDKEFYKSDEFKNMINNYDLLSDKVGFKNRTSAMKKAVQVYRDNGITDTTKISTAMKLGLSPEQGAYAIRLAENIGRSGWNNKNVRDDYEKRYRANIPFESNAANKVWNSIEDLL